MIGLLPGESPIWRGVFENSRRRYGYRRVHLELRGACVIVSAKRVMRLMARHGLVPVSRSARRYSSYRGEIGDAPVIHSDRGCHYRWPEWIRICKGRGLTRSMSAKGCSPDNAAAESSAISSRSSSTSATSRASRSTGSPTMLDEYMTWYRDERIKTEYGMSIMDRRIKLGLVG